MNGRGGKIIIGRGRKNISSWMDTPDDVYFVATEATRWELSHYLFIPYIPEDFWCQNQKYCKMIQFTMETITLFMTMSPKAKYLFILHSPLKTDMMEHNDGKGCMCMICIPYRKLRKQLNGSDFKKAARKPWRKLQNVKTPNYDKPVVAPPPPVVADPIVILD